MNASISREDIEFDPALLETAAQHAVTRVPMRIPPRQ